MARTAKARCESLAPAGSLVQLQSHKSQDKYGRYLATVTNDEGDDVGKALLAAGLAVVYFGGKR